MSLAAAQAQVRHRLARMARYRDRDVSEADIHLWQQSNPVVTEALVQLTWGGPQVLYNGGLQQARVRYYDAATRRPGLPPSVAALVSSVDPDATVVELINLDPRADRSVVVQAGAFAEHTIRSVEYTACPTNVDRRSLRLRTRRARHHLGADRGGRPVAARRAAPLDPHPVDPGPGAAHTARVLPNAIHPVRFHCWLLPPLQVQSWTRAPSAVEAPLTSRHRPDWVPVMVPLQLTVHCWLA